MPTLMAFYLNLMSISKAILLMSGGITSSMLGCWACVRSMLLSPPSFNGYPTRVRESKGGKCLNNCSKENSTVYRKLLSMAVTTSPASLLAKPLMFTFISCLALQFPQRVLYRLCEIQENRQVPLLLHRYHTNTLLCQTSFTPLQRRNGQNTSCARTVRWEYRRH